jgi:cytosine/adenosine deaminase-related metal-dependent hydrolase
MDHLIGSLEVGKQADLAAFPLLAAPERTGMINEAKLREPLMRASLVVVAGRVLVHRAR